MNFDTLLLAAVAEELNHQILGARIDKITQPAPLEVIVSLYFDGARRSLLISAEPNSARLHLIRQRSRPSPTNAPAFCMLLRKYLESGIIYQISQPLGFAERVLRIDVRRSTKEHVFLWAELMGRQSNIVLTSESGAVLGSIKRVTTEMSRFREVRPGVTYTPPPRQFGYKRDPMEPFSLAESTVEAFDAPEAAEKWLTASFRGVGSVLAKEAVLHSNSKNLTLETVWYGLNDILSVVRLKEFSPVICRDKSGQIILAYPIPVKSVPTEQQEPVSSISEAVEAAFSSSQTEDVLSKERGALLASLRRAAKAADRQLIDVRQGLLNSDQSEQIRESGELLLANIGGAPQGAKEVDVVDYFAEDPDQRRTISLDPSLTMHENAERYFRRYQKARDSKETLIARQEQLQNADLELADALAQAEAAETTHELASIAERIGDLIRTQQNSGGHDSAAKPLYEGHKIKVVKSADGWEILVGENSTSNDFLTTKVSSPTDIWLHARAVPSAHAVIRAQNRPASVSTAAILLAAEHVAKRSQAKHAGLVSVDYTLKKYVRPPRGSAPGQVTYTNEKTIDVIADDD